MKAGLALQTWPKHELQSESATSGTPATVSTLAFAIFFIFVLSILWLNSSYQHNYIAEGVTAPLQQTDTRKVENIASDKGESGTFNTIASLILFALIDKKDR